MGGLSQVFADYVAQLKASEQLRSSEVARAPRNARYTNGDPFPEVEQAAQRLKDRRDEIINQNFTARREAAQTLGEK